MPISAILFGAIGTLSETSDLQRRAFNMAFAQLDLGWHWDADSYRDMLRTPGGVKRVESYAKAVGQTIDASGIHALKEEFFERIVGAEGIDPRPGVTDLIEVARQSGVQVGLCTSTSQRQVGVILDGLDPAVQRTDFAYIGDRSRVAWPKPAPDIYLDALATMGVPPSGAVAIEDTPESAEAALGADLRVLGYPGAAARGRSFPAGVTVIGELDADVVGLEALVA